MDIHKPSHLDILKENLLPILKLKIVKKLDREEEKAKRLLLDLKELQII